MDFINKVFTSKFLNVICVLRKEDGEVYHLIKTRKRKNEIKIMFSGQFKDQGAFEVNLNLSYPVIVLMDGKGILNKKIDLASDTDINWLNNVDWSAMHYSSFTQDNTKLFSICKKSIVEDVLQQLKSKSYQVTDFYIGSLTSILLKKWIDSSRIIANETVFSFVGDLPVAFAKSDVAENMTYEIGEQTLSQNQIALYGAAIDFYVAQESLDRSKSILINKEEILYKNLFKSCGKVLLVGSFAALVMVYVATSLLATQVKELKQSNSSTSATYAQIQRMSAEKEEKLQILDDMGYSSSKFISQYVYDIINVVPDDVTVYKLNVFPLKNEVKDNKKVNFMKNTVEISCGTRNDLALNKLISQLKAFDWIEKVEVVSLKQDKKGNTLFDIKIFLRNV